MCSLRRSHCATAIALLALIACARGASAAGTVLSSVAVFPVENLTGSTIPSEHFRRFLIERLSAEGVHVLDTNALDQFLTRHRVRFTAGIEAATADALRAETGVQGVVIASVDVVGDTAPPKIALVARLVSTTGIPTVAWADDVALAGDQAPGLLDLGLVHEYDELESRALSRIGNSLIAYLKTGERPATEAPGKYRPRAVYRAVTFQPNQAYSIAVVPFLNLTDKRDAGELVALLFMRHLADIPELRVVDRGVVRQQLLDARVVMEGGISLSDADMVAALIDADFVLGGRVLRFDGAGATPGQVRVEFSSVLIERKSRRVVWSSDSEHGVTEGIGTFERGGPKTAHGVATQMVQRAAASIAGRDR